MKRLLVFVFAIMPFLAFATDEICPAGYYPAEYIELEYIESTGTQYIDTGVNTNGIVCELDYKFTVLKNESALFGNWETGKIYQVTLYNQRAYFGAGSTSEANLSIDGFNTLNRNIISLSDNGILTFNGNVVYNKPVSNSGFHYSILLFGRRAYRNNNGVQTTTLSKIRVFSFKIDQGTENLRHFIPVRRLSDNVVGMYDRVEGKFYGNNGTGEFIAGPEVQSFITDENNIVCELCPANTYKPNSGNESCTKCPTGTFSPIGSTQLSDCAKILRVKDYVVYMPLGKRTEHGLCVMSDGKKYCADVYERQ